MGAQVRPGRLGFGGHKGVDGGLAGFRVNSELETADKERFHHQAHFVLRRIAFGARLNVVAIRDDPYGQAGAKRLDLAWIHFVGKRDVGHEREGSCCEQASVGDVDVAGSEGKARIGCHIRLVLFDGRYVEGELTCGLSGGEGLKNEGGQCG